MKLSDIASKFKVAQIITHDDLDGYGSGAILVSTLLGLGFSLNDIKVTNTNYSNPFPVDESYNLVFVSDISFSNKDDARKLINFASKPHNLVLWFDHHKTSIDLSEVCPELETIPGIRDTNACGAMLCYIFNQIIRHYNFRSNNGTLEEVLKELDEIDVSKIMNSETPGIWDARSSDSITPIGIILTDDYDRFILADERSKYFMEAFNSYPQFNRDCKSIYFQKMYVTGRDTKYKEFIKVGKKIFIWKRILSLNTLKSSGFIASFPKEGMDNIEMLCLNSTNKGSMMLGKCLGDGNNNLIQYNYACIYSNNGKNFTVSIYCSKPDLTPKRERMIGKIYDASDICKRFDGGGHPGAAGFVAKSIPFCNIKPLSKALIDQIDQEISELMEEVV